MRESTGEQLTKKVQPDSTKSTFQVAKDHVVDAADDVASRIPGNQKTSDHLFDNKHDAPLTHDTGRVDPLKSIAHKVKPRSCETIGDKVERHGDNVASALEPEHHKSVGQKVMDTVNPEKCGTTTARGNCTSCHPTTGEKPGVVSSVTNAVKNTVNSVTGSGQHAHNNGHNI